MIREVMDVLDDPRVGAAEFNALLPTDVCEDLRDNPAHVEFPA
jgi:hypothetical protein